MITAKNISIIAAAVFITCLTKTAWSDHEKFIRIAGLSTEYYGVKKETRKAEPQNTQDPALVYQPPLRGAPMPEQLIGGGTRTERQDIPKLTLLAPNHLGLTVQSQPILYWHISETIETPLEFVLIQENAIEPVIELRLPSPAKPGFQRLALTKLKVELEMDSVYQWSISIVTDQNRRSTDVVESANIKYISPSQLLLAKLNTDSSTQSAFVYAKEGVWYDALESISNRIDNDPDNSSLRKMRTNLLKQINFNMKQIDSQNGRH